MPIRPTTPSNFNKITPTSIKENQNKGWSYSFKYFKQIEYFGLDKSQSKWFVSFLDRLRDLSKKDRYIVFSDRSTADFFRYHKINWQSKNVPIKKEDLNWIDNTYLQNDDEFPFYQFQVSTANGRVVGFWNENHTVFYIVLLDPLHNIQPSKNFNYKVDDCYPLSCEYSSLINDIHNITDTNSNCSDCNIKDELKRVSTKTNKTNAIIGFLDDDFLNEYEKISKSVSTSEILQLGILAYNNPTSN